MKIERNVPLPAPKPAAAKKPRVPVENMEIGDSIFFPGEKRQVAVSRCKGTAMKARLAHNFRSVAENGGARVWRIA